MTKQNEPSSLFLVRIWREDTGDGQAEWRGKVQSMLGGETRSFCGGPELVDALFQLLPQQGSHDLPSGSAHDRSATGDAR